MSNPTMEAYQKQAVEQFKVAKSFLNDKRSDAQTRYVDPASDYVNRAASEKPLPTLFLAVLVAFSILPVSVFLIFSLSTLLFIGGGALVATVLTLAFIIGNATMLLLGALAIASFFAACITGWIVAAYAAYRFAVIVTNAQNLPQGLKEFKEEAINLIFGGGFARSSSGGGHHSKQASVRFDKNVQVSDNGDSQIKSE
ncbi:lipid droplet assembly factor 1 [Sporobolomyces salmoneus]|uniref:lipid droplet assembly factor 1 n=1 Tax=Sporobolomyces salmoneus TaxID=183962 RepID=UPI00317663C2